VRVLVACEESQAVTKEFRRLGHEAFSCDIKPTTGANPEWHYQDDVFNVISKGWDMMIAFPPCTHLAISGAPHFEKKRADGRQQEGIDFFLKIANVDIDKICIENPMNIMGNIFRPHDQEIQPYYFGDEFQKTTWLWLKNLPPLLHFSEKDLFNDKITHVGKGDFIEWVDKKTGKTKRQAKWFADAFRNTKTSEERSTIRSKTFPGIAKAMAEQWGK
jgi:hypothetical protein